MDGGIGSDGRELNRNKQTDRQTDSQTNRHTVRPRHENEDSVVIQQRMFVVNRTTRELITFITLVPGTATQPSVRRFRNLHNNVDEPLPVFSTYKRNVTLM